MLVACIGKELHEIGARMVADFFELEGWDSYFIGANTPSESILQTVSDRRPDVVGLSVTLTVHLSELRSLVPRLKAINPVPKILVGGYPFNLAPTLFKRVGADGYGADAESAVLVANKLVGSAP
ncbi:MAG: cobalamin B12-binding domain-containing protein [Spirochaetes bacterium]|nr:cobalamin B12-binding domain-containing protein [Spirochaetota bacterium]